MQSQIADNSESTGRIFRRNDFFEKMKRGKRLALVEKSINLMCI